MHTQRQLLVALGLGLTSSVLVAQGAIQPISVAAIGAPGNGSSFVPVITPDARTIAFSSHATNLVAGDVNGFSDVLVRDRLTGALTRVSRATAGGQANDDSYPTGISDDGRYIVFLSRASNLAPGDTNGVFDTYLHDRQTGSTTRVTVASGGGQASSDVDFSSISGDGTVVAFASTYPFDPADTNGSFDVYTWTIATGAFELISTATGGGAGDGGSFGPELSRDGRYVSFHSTSTNLVAGDTNGLRDVFVRDRWNGTTTRASFGLNGAQSDGASRNSDCSADGRYVAYTSLASNLVVGDTNGSTDTFVFDQQTGLIERVSVSSTGAQGTGSSQSLTAYPAISADGRRVGFFSELNGLAGGNNAYSDAFVHDRVTGTTTLVSQNSRGFGAVGTSGVSGQYFNHFSLPKFALANDPPVAAFASRAPNLGPDANTLADVFAVDTGLSATGNGPAVPVGGTATMTLAAPAYPQRLFLRTFSVGATTGVFLPGLQWLPLDPNPLLTATLEVVVTDAGGAASSGLMIPNQPSLSGFFLDGCFVHFDVGGPSLFSAITNVVPFVIL